MAPHSRRAETGPLWEEILPPARPPARGTRRALRTSVFLLAGCVAVAVALVTRALWPAPSVSLSEAFGDDGLRACIARTLGVSRDGVVAERDLEAITSLECARHSLKRDGYDRASIERLDGIERLVGLEQITLTWQHVTDLRPLATLPNLSSLGLAYVDIMDLTGVGEMPALTYLDLSRDGCFSGSSEAALSDIVPLAGAGRLTNLNLSCTDVSDISALEDLTGLTTLALGGTDVIDLEPLAGHPALRVLSLSYTSVHDLTPLADVETLRALLINGTKVTDVSPLDKLPDLEITR